MLRKTFGILLVIAMSFAQSYGQCDAAFSGPRQACLGDTLTFSALSSGLQSSDWDFGDASSDTGHQVNHVYTTAGNYVLRHIIIDLSACRDTVYDTIHVYRSPLLGFTSETNCSDDLVHLYGIKSVFDGDQLDTLFWDTGTGDTLFGDTVSFIYPASGFYQLKLWSSGLGCEARLDTQVFIVQRPQADFTTDQNLCQGDTVAFNYTGGAYSARYSWNFGDVFSGNANTDSIASPRHRFSNFGSFSVRIVVQDSLNCRDTLLQTILIRKKAEAAVDYSDACLGLQTLFQSNVSLGNQDSVTTYRWFFGD
ncbi:MAG: PKD domain-containing protein, partial [Bacteroidota bacterium]|nr:PKD domain-containing protein [Bacteroidota bacterium]